MKITNWKDCIRNRTKWVEEEEEEEEEDPQTYALAYGYIGARTDTTQETNICLGIHCRNVRLHLNRQPFCPLQRHSNPMRTAAGIWPDCRLETNPLCWRQTAVEDNIPVVSVSV